MTVGPRDVDVVRCMFYITAYIYASTFPTFKQSIKIRCLNKIEKDSIVSLNCGTTTTQLNKDAENVDW